MAKEKIYSRLLVSTFLLFLLFPGFIMIARQDTVVSEQEKRKLAELPSLNWSLDSVEQFPKDFDDYFNDHFGLREHFISLHNSFFTKVFSTSPNRNVIWGRDRWLFLANDGVLADYLGQGITRDTTIQTFIHELVDRKRWLEERNIRYLFVPVPNKIQVYGENLPERYTGRAGISMYDRLVEAAGERGEDVPLLDLLPVMQQKKNKDQLYFRTDTHWTYTGGYLGYTKIIQYLSRWFPSQSPMTQDGFIFKNKKYSGDLASLLHLRDAFSEKIEDVAVIPHCKGEHLRDIEWPFQNDFGGKGSHIYRSRCSEKPLTAIILQDSFGSFTARYFSQHFGTAYYFPGWNFRNIVPYLDEMQPDVIIDLHVSRNVPKTLRPHPEVTALAAELLFQEAPLTLVDFIAEQPKGLNWRGEHIDFSTSGARSAFVATSNDPQLFFPIPDMQQVEDAVLHINIVSPAKTSLQLFYKQGPDEVFSEGQSHVFSIEKGENSIYMRLPASSEVRLDPGQEPGLYRLNSFVLRAFPSR